MTALPNPTVPPTVPATNAIGIRTNHVRRLSLNTTLCPWSMSQSKYTADSGFIGHEHRADPDEADAEPVSEG